MRNKTVVDSYQSSFNDAVSQVCYWQLLCCAITTDIQDLILPTGPLLYSSIKGINFSISEALLLKQVLSPLFFSLPMKGVI